jgi:hypothetical protein
VTALAMATGISFDVWMEGDEQALETALELRHEEAQELKRQNRR